MKLKQFLSIKQKHNQAMELIRIQDTRHTYWDDAWAIYEHSFPIYERRPVAEHIKALGNSAFHYNLLLDDGRLVGILSWWDWTDAESGTLFRLCEHFAISPDVRGGGYGTEALGFLFADAERIVILEIDPLTDDITRRREQFYLRNGLVANYHFDHFHPSFQPATTQPFRLLVMSHPRSLTNSEFAEFQRFNEHQILRYSE